MQTDIGKGINIEVNKLRYGGKIYTLKQGSKIGNLTMMSSITNISSRKIKGYTLIELKRLRDISRHKL